MWIFTHLDKELKQAIRLLSLGTFLEYFDLFLYVHMAVLLNGLFFPPADLHAQSLLTALAFCSSFVFRPIGALFFGYIGDKYGRKITIVITTFMMAITCLIMANAPTYDQIGIAAAWIITLCRILQGMSSMGEIIGAQLFLTEATPLPVRFPVVGLIVIFADIGAIFAIGIAALTTAYGFNWRMAFWLGAGIALIGSIMRTTLRESPEFADARRRLQNVADRNKESTTRLKKGAFYNKFVSFKTAFSYFAILCPGPAIIYFVFFYSTNALKNILNYDTHHVILHNFLLGTFQLISLSIFRTYLSTKVHPLKILKFAFFITSLIMIFIPNLFNYVVEPWQLFTLQSILLIFIPGEFPAMPIFFKTIPLFKRFSYSSFIFALARAFIYILTSFGLTYLISYFGYYGLLILMAPVLIGYGYGLQHFITLEKAAGRYPKMMTWNMAE